MSAKTSRAQRKYKTRWIGVGVHPTPNSLVRTFSDAIEVAVRAKGIQKGTQSIEIADLFAGDGRLGRSMSTTISKLVNVPVKTTFVEFDPSRAQTIQRASRSDQIIIADAFQHVGQAPGYDAVVANPPFLALTEKSAKRLALHWNEVMSRGRNLYGIAISHAISVCRPGGLVALICPFGWLRGTHFRLLRRDLLQSCDEAHVIALSSRKAFPGVQQDIALHLLRKRKSSSLNGHAKILFSLEGRKGEEILLHTEPAGRELVDHFRVRVGPLVWNREKHSLTKDFDGRTRVLYGGNIGTGQTLNWSHSRYRKRQYLRRNARIGRFSTNGPAIAIRRTLKGSPGSWEIDSCAIGRGKPFIAENHVVLVKVPSRFSLTDTEAFRGKLLLQIKALAKSLGSPNLTSDLVTRALTRVVVEP
jgi:hypothetical protein